jgi:hypothetical protein
MEITLDTIIAILTLFIGGGGGAFFTWRWQRKKAKAEAKTAERIAAERYGAASTKPLPVTSRGDAKASELVTKFKAISDPKEQTVFWRSLSTEQRTLILNAQ